MGNRKFERVPLSLEVEYRTAGSFLVAFLGAPIGALLVLVVLKTVFDLGLHLRERRAADARIPADTTYRQIVRGEPMPAIASDALPAEGERFAPPSASDPPPRATEAPPSGPATPAA